MRCAHTETLAGIKTILLSSDLWDARVQILTEIVFLYASFSQKVTSQVKVSIVRKFIHNLFLNPILLDLESVLQLPE